MPSLRHRADRLVRRLPGAPRVFRLARAMRLVPEAVRSVTDPERSRTFYPDAPRKGTLRMIADQLGYLFRHSEVDTRYFMYGLDRAGVGRDAVVEYPEFRRIRDRGHAARSPSGLSYACVMEDKYLFGQIAASFGFPSPRNLAFVDQGMVQWIGERDRQPLEALLGRNLDGFCKPLAGISSRGVFALRIKDGTVEIDGELSTLSDLRARLSERYLVQERISQHPDLARLHPPSVNTLRVTTVLEEGNARVFRTILRMGRDGASYDGHGAGGIGVSADVESGRLNQLGLARAGSNPGWYDHHPDTGIRFDGLVIPFFEEAKTISCQFHEALPFFHTIGWDVAITQVGPLIIEGNENWGATIHVSIEPGFKNHFLDLYL